MSVHSYEIRQCPNCGLRYPIIADHPFGPRCPSCLGGTQVVLQRTISSSTEREKTEAESKTNISAMLDNIRSAWNVGAIFRTADGLGMNKLYLCGITPTPDNESMTKTSLGAEKSVAWEYAPNAVEMVKKVKSEGFKLIALEQDARAIPIKEYQDTISDSRVPILILGNEITGVDPEILDMCDRIVHIPMRGKKRSLNVEVAFGIAVSHLLQG